MLKKPWLLIPSSLAHKVGPLMLRLFSFFKKRPAFSKSLHKNLLGFDFEHSFGTAGGLDKTAKDLNTWYKWGASFLEIGTFTPKPQGPNPGKIIDRDIRNQALWNCMGFPNPGFEAVKPKIEKFKKSYPSLPLFINIGKNRTTALETAYKDYIAGLDFFNLLADFFVINISSPNTQGLRELHKKENFKSFIEPILNHKKEKLYSVPLLLKTSPDLDDETFKNFLINLKDLDIEGLILTNTTSTRAPHLSFPEHGGVSGAPLNEISLEKLKVAKEILGESKLIISVGGVLTPEDAKERIKYGADLVQFYSGLIFYGPSLIQSSALSLK